jgi:hypothetical protein
MNYKCVRLSVRLSEKEGTGPQLQCPVPLLEELAKEFVRDVSSNS